ncbi:MAG: hypothetical protein NVS1B13_21710 [Flavisolibacter sp.]
MEECLAWREKELKSDYYHARNKRTLGKGIITEIGLSKYYGNIYIVPKIIIPVYQSLNYDPVFLEGSGSMTKWFNGTGLSFSIGKTF